MQATYYKDADVIDYTPGAAIAAGDVVLVGTTPLVATRAIANGTLGQLDAEGVFKVVKAEESITAGDAIYWDADGNPYGGTAGTGAATGTASGNNLMGFAIADAGSTDSTVSIKLTAAKRTATIAGSVTADDITGSDSSLGIAGLAATAGGAIVIAGGASSGGNNNGGAITIRGGAKNGSGANGVVTIGDSNTSAVTLAAASVATTITGPLTRGIGASTAAAGNSTSDAGALPAGTAGIYPTTAADDTKGVIINAADKVTGRTLFIGNGVSNKILKVYPPSGGTINGASADAAFSSASGKGVIVVCLSSGDNSWLAW